MRPLRVKRKQSFSWSLNKELGQVDARLLTVPLAGKILKVHQRAAQNPVEMP
jgi:hypothetical protein